MFKHRPTKSGGNYKRISVNENRIEDGKNKEIFRQREQVRTFLIQLDWATADDGEGITWLELLILFRLHGGAMIPDGEDAAEGLDHPTWSMEMKAFKSAVRWTTAHNIGTTDEWHLETSYYRYNRLAGLGITNKHAAVRGMPKLSVEQAQAVSKFPFKSKGLLKNGRDKEIWNKGKLFAVPKPFYPKGPVQKIPSEDMLKDMQTKAVANYLAILDKTRHLRRFTQSYVDLSISSAQCVTTL